MKKPYLIFILSLSFASFVYVSNRSGNTVAEPSENRDVLTSNTDEFAHISSPQTTSPRKLENTNSQIQISQNASTWPQDVIASLKQDYSNQSDAIDHIVRATTFGNFATLSTEKSERLIRYTDHVTGLPPQRILNLCWHYNTPGEERNAFEGVRSLALSEASIAQPIFQGNNRWQVTATDGSTGSSGTPVTIRWSFVPNGAQIPDFDDNYSGSDLITQFNIAYGAPSVPGDLTTAPWFEIFADAFAYWSEKTGNIYIYEPNDDGASFPDSSGQIGVRGDVRIGGKFLDGNSSLLAFNYFPDFGDMIIDTGDSLNLGDSGLDIVKNVIAHEHGHGLGLDHVCPGDSTKLMEPFITTNFVGPQFDDILTAQELYGDLLERQSSNKNNESTSTAYDFGTLNANIDVTELSIGDASDTDIFSFRISTPKVLDLSVTPTDQGPYLEGAQNNNGSCSSGVLYDPQDRQDLILRVLDDNGTTVLASSNISSIGSAESIDQLQLTDLNQNYYIEVTGGGENGASGNNAQSYDLSILLTNSGPLQISTPVIISESCSPANGAADPGELIAISVTVENTSSGTETNISITLSGNSNLTILGDASFAIGALAAGESATREFSFLLSGDCGATESILLRAESNNNSVERTENSMLGATEIVLANFDSTATGSLPTNFTQSSGNSSADWRTVSTDSSSSPNSIYSPGLIAVNSALLTSPEITTVTAQTQLKFNHKYDLENNLNESIFKRSIDGGVLEISIDGGSWQEWKAGGGTFLSNGYNGSIPNSTFIGSPLGGRDVWTGKSNGFIETIAAFPSAAIGKSAKVRWHLGSDRKSRNDGWWIDDIILVGPACCDSIIPLVSVAAVDFTTREFEPTDTAEFAIASDINVSGNFPVAYTLSGDAIEGSDFVALAGSAIIPNGQNVTSIPITAITDAMVEGDETLTITLTPSVLYSIGTATATISIKDLPFDEYRNSYFGENTANIAEDEDFDFDGIKNLIEYAFRLDPTHPETLPFSLLVENNGKQNLELHYYEDTRIDDINYIVETSSTLVPESWTTEGVTITLGATTDGLISKIASIPVSIEPGFIRIRIERMVP